MRTHRLFIFFTVLMSGNAFAQGNFFNRGTLTIAAGSEVEVKGKVVLDKPVTGAGYFSLTGSALQTMEGDALETGNFRMNNTGDATLRTDMIVHQSADFQSGHLSLEDNDLRLGSVSGGNPSGFIVTNTTGEIILPVSSVPVSLPLGSALGFHPLTLAENGTPDTFYIRSFSYLPSNGLYNGAPVTSDVALLSWNIRDRQAGGNNLDLGFEWYDAVNAGSFNERFAVPLRYNGSAYTNIENCATDVRFVNPNNIAVSGIASTGVFGIGDEAYLPYTPQYSITPNSDTAFCSGGNVVYTARSGTAYQWSNGNSLQNISVSQSETVFVDITNPSGCIYSSDTVTVTVWPLPVAGITPPVDTALCQNDTMVFSATGGTDYVWSTTEVTSSINVSQAGDYFVDAFDANGCTGRSDTVSVTILPPPAAPLISRTTNTLQSTSATSYQWYRDGNLIPGAVSQNYPVTQNGTYTVEITNASGCTAVSAPYIFNDLGIPGNENWSYTIGPNPSSGTVHIQLSGSPSGKLVCTVTDMLGRKITGQNVNSSLVELHLPVSGMYTVTLTSGKETLLTERVVIY